MMVEEIKEQILIPNFEKTPNKFRVSYESCCGKIDKECFDFVSRMILIFSVLVFAMIQVNIVKDVNQHQIYLSIITSILGYMLPSPTLRSNK